MVKILCGYNENEQIKSWELSLETLAPQRSIQSYHNINFSGHLDKKPKNGSQNSIASL